MRKPQRPPPWHTLLSSLKDAAQIAQITELGASQFISRQYLPWDRLRRYPLPEGTKIEDVWLAAKLQRLGVLKSIPLLDKSGAPFQFCVPELVLEDLHRIDVGAGAAIGVPEQITNPQTRDRYLIRSLMEEAITSSQLEGAATTCEVAKEMIRTGRPPRDKDEQMIVNNFITMQRISKLKKQPLSPEMVFEIHRRVTEKTLENESAAGRLRRPDEKCVVSDDEGEIYHDPPRAEELQERLNLMCEFANEKSPGFFVHPVVRAVILHFWLAYDHPFIDGNGRTARALFYWSMLHSGYWLFEFISISTILRKAPIKYARSFLYTETDNNDLTYFILAQCKVIHRAIGELHAYIDRKALELRQLESQIRALNLFNHRQVDLIRHAIKHPDHRYTIQSHKKSHNVVYQTARTDLLDLVRRKILDQKKVGKRMEFIAPNNVAPRLGKLGKKA
jgi:Fic family protein